MNAEVASKIFASVCVAGILGGLSWVCVTLPLPLAISAGSFLALLAFLAGVGIWA